MAPGQPSHGPTSPRQVVVTDLPGSVSVEAPLLAQRLRAAKPVTWRGKGDLIQVPWAPVLRGTWLVVDLWAGLSGLCIALLQSGLHFYGVAAECDGIAAGVAQSNMPNLVHVQSVEELRADFFVPFLQRHRPRGVIMGGGSPCQGNSSLNSSRQGLADQRSRQPTELARLRDEFAALPDMQGVELVVFLENVASMPKAVRSAYSDWMQGEPVLIDSGCCGWVQRRRLYWLTSRASSLTSTVAPPAGWVWEPTACDVPQLVYQGEKPLPNRCFFHQGFQPLFDPKEIVKHAGEGAMHPFTREFFHPVDRVAASSAEAVSRFMADARRFPPSAYEAGSLLWKQDEWRQPYPDERAQLMGIPPESLGQVPGGPALKRQRQNSLLGNGFHLYAILALFAMLPALLEAKIPRHVPGDEGVLLAERLQFSIWEPGRLPMFPGLFTAEDVVNRLPGLFPECPLSPTVWSSVLQKLQHCDLPALQAYTGWCRMRGMDVTELGPQPLHKGDRARIYSGLSGQRYPTDSSKGLDHLLPPGLGKRGHMNASAELPSPFQPTEWPEFDVVYVVDAICRWQTALPAYTAKLRHLLTTVARAVRPLEEALTVWRVESSRRVAADKRPGFLAAMTILLRWPDVYQAQNLVRGYPIVGHIAATGVFRTVEPRDIQALDDWLEQADAVVDALVRARPPKHAEDILQQTRAEQAKGFCSPFYSRSALDSMFGKGRWRPLERFQIVQADQKKRMIDNCRRTEHNSHTSMAETIFTVSVDFVASVASSLARRLVSPSSSLCALDWLRLRLGSDDLPDAYRGLPVLPAHQPFSVVAIYVPSVGWRFTVLWGLAFGLESAVVAFNRFPQVGIAISRRCCLALTAAYFDDELAVEAIADSDVSQQGLRLVFQLLGAMPQPDKSFRPTANRHYLGTSIHTGDFLLLGIIRVQPKHSTRAKVLARLDLALATNSLSRDEAGKLRGDVTWLFTMCLGHLGKLAGPTLTAHQYGEDPTLTSSDRLNLQVLRRAVLLAEPRDITVLRHRQQLVRVYTDASFEAGQLRLGWVIFRQSETPIAGTCLVPQATLAQWKPRTQQIFPGETLAALVLPQLCPNALRGSDVLWFIDNEAAAAALVRVASSESDILFLVQQAHLAFHSLNMRVWFEWIDTEANPADGLSRDGLDDEWTRAQPWSVHEYVFPSFLTPQQLLHQLAESIDESDSG